MSFFSDKYRLLPSFRGKKRIGSLLFRNAIYKYQDRIIRCKDGLRFHVLNTHDSIGRDLFLDGEYEPETVNLMRSLLTHEDVMIDAGANIGVMSIPAAHHKNIQVYAFEPAHHIYEILEKNILLNQMGNVKAIPLALSDKDGVHDFYESNRMHGWSGMVKIDSFQHYQSKTITLDSFAKEQGIEKIKVLKADVQGWEYFVFKGAERLMDEGRIEHIIFEFEWWAEKNAGLEPGAAQQFLMEKGYRLETLAGDAIDKPKAEGAVMIHAMK